MRLQDKLFLLVNQLIYRILGPKFSTDLAHSWLGKLCRKFMARNANVLKIFEGKEGLKLKLTKNEAMELGFYYLGVINPLETAVVKRVLSEGDTFIDVGTYKDGWHSLLAAKRVGNTGRVYAFEPHPVFFQRLKENIALNNLLNITAEKLALSNKEGEEFLYEAEESSSFFKEKIPEEKLSSNQPLVVPTTTIDAYIKKKKIKKVRLVKIDVEGAEMKVLEGAENLLTSKNPPDLMVEVVDTYLKAGRSSKEGLLCYLSRFGYQPYVFTPGGLKFYLEGKNQPTLNLFFRKQTPSSCLSLVAHF